MAGPESMSCNQAQLTETDSEKREAMLTDPKKTLTSDAFAPIFDYFWRADRPRVEEASLDDVAPFPWSALAGGCAVEAAVSAHRPARPDRF